jgi:AAA+ ATPase superfamily predicted ATPase
VSLLGERRIGKSSLLNQVVQALNAEENMVVIHATAQDWNQHS